MKCVWNIALLLITTIFTACAAVTPRTGQTGFQLVATYRPGLSEAKPWDAKISATGEVSKTTYISGNSDETVDRKVFSLTQDDITELVKIIRTANLFSAQGDIFSTLDFGQRSLTITIDGVSQKISMPSVPTISDSHDDLRALSDFERVWDEIFKIAPWLGENRYASTIDNPGSVLLNMGCLTCHNLPGDPRRPQAALGGALSMKTIAPRRVASPDYAARRAAGKAHAQTEKEYVMESILAPHAFTVPGGVPIMPVDYGDKFSYSALDRVSEFLLSIDESSRITTKDISSK